jgi:hypothetical protein
MSLSRAVAMRHRATRALVIVGCAAFLQGASIAQGQSSTAEDLTPQARAALTQLRDHPTWLFPAEECPADVMPRSEVTLRYPKGRCKPHLQSCLDDCASHDANACYALALAAQELKTDNAIAEALFLRACRLGMVSGCTNRAAGMVVLEPDNPRSTPCAVRTYEMTCASDDAWGCTMYGYHLMAGKGVPQDLDQAARVLPKGCRHGPEDAACRKATSFIRWIEGERSKQSGKSVSDPD